MYVRGQHAANALGITQSTLRKLATSGRIKHYVLPSGQRRYLVNSFDNGSPTVQKDRIIYARVSSSGQKDDLQRQIDMLQDAFPDHKVVTDIASGINFKKKGLQTILEQAMRREISEVVVAHRDRLARFAFELVAWILHKNGVKLVVQEPSVDTAEKELVDDLISIVTVFANRTYGRRKYKSKPTPREEPEGPSKPQPQDPNLPQ